MDNSEEITLEYVRRFPSLAKESFSFLSGYNLFLVEERQPRSTFSKDGFYLRYSNGSLLLEVEYYDMELIPAFQKEQIKASYYFLDRNLFANASGLHGAMFPLAKLESALRRISSDIKQHYHHILAGDENIWRKIEALLAAPVGKRKLP